MSNDQNIRKHFKDLINHNVSVVATNPAEMQAAGEQLKEYLTAKLELLGDELKEMHELVRVTEKAGMNSVSVKRRVKLVEKRITYYSKIMAAIHAGYHIIPDFPVDIFAVRTNKERPAAKHATYRHSESLLAQTQQLPAGQGRYVAAQQMIESEHWEVDGRKHNNYWPVDFCEIEFPIALVKPQVIEATGAAFDQLIFDEIGICQQNAGDPMVIGRLKVPGSSYKYTCFLITWFLEAKDL